MLEGIIIKGIGGFYYVKTNVGIIECRARGIFRERKITPLIGDKVLIRISKEDDTGYIEEIFPRKSQLTRPPVANITQAIIVMSIKDPNINCWLLDRFLVMAEYEKLNVKICLNKIDLASSEEINLIHSIYDKTDYNIIKTSIKTNQGLLELKNLLKDNVTVFAGPSGVGKSSLLNKIDPILNLETGEVSKKNTRGKHTTRHVELIDLDTNTYVLDTPGFSSINLDFIKSDAGLAKYFKEIYKYSDNCKFISCLHHKEPGCEVKKQLEQGNISKSRYENYLLFLDEIKNIRRY